MFEKKTGRIELGGITYPYVCDILVLERIQTEYGDLTAFEDGIWGLIPYFDENGERDRAKDKRSVPNTNMVCSALTWMIEEGIDITGEEIEVPTIKDIKQQSDYSIPELVLMVNDAYSTNFTNRRKKS